MSQAVELAYCSAIQKSVTGKYPNIGDLWKYNPNGTLKLLQAKQALSYGKKDINLRINHTGNSDGVTVWADYKKAIKGYLEKVNKQEELETARERICDIIHHNHYQKLPHWPAKGKENSRLIDLDKMGCYKLNDLEIYWACKGTLQVKDIHYNNGTKYTECKTAPNTADFVLKILQINHTKLKKINALCLSSFSTAKKKADEYTNEALTWDDI